MPPRLFDFLNKPKYQILYYLFRYGKISTRHSKAAIMRAFGYSSSGHFYPDFDDLLDNEFIIIKKGFYRLGSKGKRELLFYSSTEIGLYFTISFSILFLWYYIMSITGVEISNIGFLMISIFLAVFSLIFYRTRRNYTPNLPNTVHTLRNRD